MVAGFQQAITAVQASLNRQAVTAWAAGMLGPSNFQLFDSRACTPATGADLGQQAFGLVAILAAGLKNSASQPCVAVCGCTYAKGARPLLVSCQRVKLASTACAKRC